MERFTDTLTETLWNDDPDAPELANHVTGVQGCYAEPDEFSDVMYGWIPLAQFDPLAWEIAAPHFDGTSIVGHTAAATVSQLIAWDPVKIVNQGFELPASGDDTLPARWTRSLSTSTTAFRDDANKTSGDWGLTVIANGSTYQRLVQSWTHFETSVSYTVTFDGVTDGSGAGGRVLVYNQSTPAILAAYNFTNTTWQTHSFTFTSPAGEDDVVTLQLGYIYYTVTGGETHYDNVSIKRTGDSW